MSKVQKTETQTQRPKPAKTKEIGILVNFGLWPSGFSFWASVFSLSDLGFSLSNFMESKQKPCYAVLLEYRSGHYT